MIDSRLDELVQLRIDGRLAPDEQKELDLSLARDSEARRYLDEMTSVAVSLDNLGELRPPTELPEQISALIARENTDVEAPPIAAMSSHSPWNRRRAVRVGLFLAASIVIAFMLAPIVVNQLDTDQLGGTMTSVEAEPDATAAWSIPVAVNGIDGSIVIERSNDHVLVDLKIESSDASEAVIEFEPDVIGLETVDGLPDSSAVRMDRPGVIAVVLQPHGAKLAFARHSGEKGSMRVEIKRQKGDALEMETEFEEIINF